MAASPLKRLARLAGLLLLSLVVVALVAQAAQAGGVMGNGNGSGGVPTQQLAASTALHQHDVGGLGAVKHLTVQPRGFDFGATGVATAPTSGAKTAVIVGGAVVVGLLVVSGALLARSRRAMAPGCESLPQGC